MKSTVYLDHIWIHAFDDIKCYDLNANLYDKMKYEFFSIPLDVLKFLGKEVEDFCEKYKYNYVSASDVYVCWYGGEFQLKNTIFYHNDDKEIVERELEKMISKAEYAYSGYY